MKPLPEKLFLSRRRALKTLGASAALLGLGLWQARAQTPPPSAKDAAAAGPHGPFILPPLAFAIDALEPHIDAKTMEIHHGKHHQAYITAANKAVAGRSELLGLEPVELLRKLDSLPEPLRTTLHNNVGGHANHAFFWSILSPRGGGEPGGDLADELKKAFGDYAKFQEQFADAAMKRFGSGWAWLLKKKDGKLAVESSANQDSPLMTGAMPILGLDVWEHAYYLKYQNRRADYVKAFWNVVNWEKAGEYFRTAG